MRIQKMHPASRPVAPSNLRKFYQVAKMQRATSKPGNQLSEDNIYKSS
jgi:hypothetical protein